VTVNMLNQSSIRVLKLEDPTHDSAPCGIVL
jgi:hypothetical protein